MTNQLQVYREDDIISTFKIDEGAVFVDKLQGERTITCPVASKDALQLEEGDYIIHENEVYIINNLPDFEKDGSKLQKSYNIVFESEFYLLLDTYVINGLQQKEFPLYGSAEDHLQLIFNNANRNDTGWSIGEVEATGGELINYNWTYVRTALNEIAERFKLEWSFTGRELRMVSTIGTDTNLTFEVGRGKGLHQIKRTKDTSKNVLTRVFGVGGSRNIDYTYRGGIEKNLIFEGGYVETPGVTAGTERVREGKYTNEEIYPRFNGVVGSVVVHKDDEGLITDVVITDAAIDFDINDHLQEGEKALVHFRTGALTGTDFEIYSYNHSTKAIELIPVADTNGYVLPNDLNLPVSGDKFTLLDLRMPTAYIVAAELELRNATLQFLEDNRKARLLFGAKPDQRHLRANNIRLRVGDRATVVEADAQVNEILRFTEISYPLVNSFDVTAVIGNEISYDRVVKLFADTIQTRKDVQTIDRRSAELAKRGVQNLRALESSIFDTDGKFDADKFNVGVLSAILGIFGAKSQNFKLNGVYITDNYNGDNSKVFISGGELIHFEISNPGNANIWTMTSRLAESLVATDLYYVYAKCSQLSQVGSWVVTTEQIKPEDEPDYYHFLSGVIYPVIDSWRNSDFTNGIADINGNRLKIGKVVSRDGLTGFDLDASEIFGRIVFRAAGGGLKNVSDVDDAALSAISLATTAQGVADAANLNASAANAAAVAAQTSANNALIAANDAQEDADAANGQLADIANDNLLTVSEKPDVLKEWLIIQGEKPIIEAQAGQYSVDITNYTAAYNALRAYLNSLLADMNINSSIVGDDFRVTFKAYYDLKVLTLKYISDSAKILSDNAQTSANNVQANLNALSAGLGGMAYTDLVQLAMLGESIVVGGYIKADLIEISTLIVRGGLETSTGAQSKADAAKAAAAADASAKIEGIKLGGTNLLRDTGKIITNSTYQTALYKQTELLTVGESYTLTIWGIPASQWYPHYNGGSNFIGFPTEIEPNVWSITFQPGTNDNNTGIGIYVYNAPGIPSTINKVKLEKGNKGTDWSPSPDDKTLGMSVTDVSNGKIFHNPFSINYNATFNSRLRIDTGVPLETFGSFMTSVKIKGVNYYQGSTDIDLTINYYSYTNATAFYNYGFVNKGSLLINQVQLAISSENTVVLLIGEIGFGWDYPQINVESASFGYMLPPDSFKDNWSGSFTDDFSDLSHITELPAFISESTSGASLKAQVAKDEAEASAKVYADAQDTLTAIQAEAYADGIVDAEEARAIADAENKLAIALADSTAKSEAARIAAEIAAESYANAQSAYEREVAKAYADGIVSTEELARIADVQNKLAQANDYTDAVGKITLIANGKILNNPFSISESPKIGCLQIDTGIKFDTSNYMCSIRIKGYNYVAGKTDIDLAVGFYAYYEWGFVQTGFSSSGSYKIDKVRLAVNAFTNSIVIIIGQDNQAWEYPKIIVEKAIITITIPPDSFWDNWTGLFSSDITNLENITDLPAFISESSEGAQAKAALAQAAAETYAAAQAAYEREVAKAYADGIVDTEEAERIAQALINLNEAKADATAKAEAARIAASLDASSKVDAITGGSINLLENTARFANADNWQNAIVQGNHTDGTQCLRSTSINGGTLYNKIFALKPNTVYTFSCQYYAVGTETPQDQYPLWVEFPDGVGAIYGTQYWLNSNQIIEKDNFKKISLTFMVPNENTRVYLYLFNPNATAQPYFTYVKLEEGSQATTWTEYTPGLSEIDAIAQAKANAAIASANATAESIAQSKANIAEANAISAAAGDATGKANAARLAAEAASANYADTVANSAASAAQIAAAADASNKANQAKIDAENAAAAAQAALTAQLKNMAYTEIDQLEGITTITKNGVTTVKLDADYVKANIVNADYIEALEIVATTLAATSGTIGGWDVGSTKLFSGTNPGDYIELQAGTSPQLYMRNSSQVTGEYSSINSKGLYISSDGNTLNISNWGNYKAVGAFKLKSGSIATDVALFSYAPATATALWVDGKTYMSNSLSVASTIQAQSLIVINGVTISGGIFVNGGAVINGITNKINAVGSNTIPLWVATSGANSGRIYFG